MSVPTSPLSYQYGFGNEFSTEAEPGALPVGRNSPQQAPLGLYAEQLSGAAFTVPRPANRRTWVYRVRPSAAHPAFRPAAATGWRTSPLRESGDRLDPNRLRWDPAPWPGSGVDFEAGLFTIGATGDAAAHTGIGIHTYGVTGAMADRVLVDADGELVVLPQEGRLRLRTELGQLDVAPGELAVVPRGIRFAVDPLDGRARGYVVENYGAPLTLPEHGLIGPNGLADPRDFRYPIACPAADVDRPTCVVQRFGGARWEAEYDHSPLDVVGWRGTYSPYAFDVSRFTTLGTVSWDHPDPSIYTVLTSPSELPGLANLDVVVFPPRWLVGEGTFRPPYFHRNVMSEFMGLVRGAYDAKAEGFAPGGASLHNSFSSHGPDAATYAAASTADLVPQKVDDTLAFMFETRWPVTVTAQAYDASHRQADYDAAWAGLPRHHLPVSGTVIAPSATQPGNTDLPGSES